MASKKNNKDKSIKNRGKVYTPPHIVKLILNLSNYQGKNILKKQVIDNSCGDGAFLVEIVDRYIKEAILNNYKDQDIKNDLEHYIHGIEIDKTEQKKCIQNVSNIAEKYKLTNIKWDIICDNTLSINKYDNKMDFVVGNPPYVRVHNLGDNINSITNFEFSQKGMKDLFIVFYEIGLKMLNKTGILGYITPSSLFNSLAGKNIRNYLIEKKLITKVVDFKHTQLFNATTYSSILILSNVNKEEHSEYYEYNSEEESLIYIDKLDYQNFYINNNFYFSNKLNLSYLNKILNNKKHNYKIEVKNGFATLNDKFFIGDFDFNNYIIPIIKASTGKTKKCIYPYKNGCLISYEELIKDEKLKNYFEQNKSKLKKRSLEKMQIGMALVAHKELMMYINKNIQLIQLSKILKV